jgi:hypothetical protein
MAEAVTTLDSLRKVGGLRRGGKCTAVEMTTADGTKALICKEDLVSEVATAPTVAPMVAMAPSCKKLSKHGRCLGRPRGSSPKNVRYVTKRGRTPKQPQATSCPADSRHWVDVTVGGGKKARRCRCTAAGNKRYLKSSECR